jgi:hypothetical protein
MSEYEVSRYLSKIGSRGGTKSASLKTPSERSALARKASLSRRKIKKPQPPQPQSPVTTPTRWFGLFDETDLNKPVLVMYSQDKKVLRERARQEERDWYIDTLDYDPRTRATVMPEFQPDTAACLQALRELETLIKGGRK